MKVIKVRVISFWVVEGRQCTIKVDWQSVIAEITTEHIPTDRAMCMLYQRLFLKTCKDTHLRPVDSLEDEFETQ